MTSVDRAGWFFAKPDIAPELRLVVEQLAAPWRGSRPPPAGPLDPSRIIALVAHHRVAAPLYHGLKASHPELAETFRHVALRQERRAATLAMETVRVSRHLRAAAIPFLVIKGAALSVQLHARPSARSSRDIDLLLPAGELAALTRALGEVGYHAVPDPKANNAFEYRNSATGFLIEAHTALAEVDALLPMDRFRPYDDSTHVSLFGAQVPTLRLEKAVVYAAYHGTRHLWSELAWVLDMAVATGAGVNWDDAHALADRLGISPQLALGSDLAHDLLGAPRPQSMKRQAIQQVQMAAMAHLRACPPVIQEDAVAGLGRFAFLRWEMRQYESLTSKITVLFKHCRTSPADRAMIALPRGLAFLYTPLRLARITIRWLLSSR